MSERYEERDGKLYKVTVLKPGKIPKRPTKIALKLKAHGHPRCVECKEYFPAWSIAASGTSARTGRKWVRCRRCEEKRQQIRAAGDQLDAEARAAAERDADVTNGTI